MAPPARLAAALALACVAGPALAQPPWLPWKVENKNLVSGEANLHSPHVWIAGRHVPSFEACLALCEKNETCNSCDWATSWSDSACDGARGNWDSCDGTAPCGAAGTCYFRNDHFFEPVDGTGCNHTCATRVKPAPPKPKPPPAPPTPLPPLPPPPAVKPP